jgi:6-phosphogluconolactonase (cycloisomerase 2 family)
MTLYLPIVPSKIDGFECIPINQKDDLSDPFAAQTSSENKFKLYYDLSPLNQDSDFTHIGIRFLSVDSNSNPILDKYSLGVYIDEKKSDPNGFFIEPPAHLFIRPSNTVGVNNIGIDPTDSIPKIITGTGPTTYRNITYQDYDLIKSSGVNKFYRSQIKLINLTANNSFSYTSSQWTSVVKANTSISSGNAVITVSDSTGILPGLNVSGAGISLGATVASISGTTVTLNANSTQTTTSTVSFYIGQNFLGSNYASDWSYQTIMKPIFISNLLGFDDENKEYIGIVDFKSRLTSSGSLYTTSNTASFEYYPFEFQYPINESEKIIEYKFTLFDSLKNEIDSSGVQEIQRYLNQTSITWTNSTVLENELTYYISIYFKTENGFQYTKRYELTPQHTFQTLELTFNVKNDRENGRIEFEIDSVGTQSNTLLLLRASLDEGYDNFKTVALFETKDLITTDSKRKYFYDYFIEPGMLYKYKFQNAESNSLGQIISRGVTLNTFATELDGTNYIEASNLITSYPFTLETYVNLNTLITDQPIMFISDTTASANDKYYGFKYDNFYNKFSILAAVPLEITKQTTPTVIPSDEGYDVAFSPSDTYMAVAHFSAPYISIYKRSLDTFTKLIDPSILPAGIGHGVAWSSDETYLSVAHSLSPYISIYKRSGDTFTKLINPASLPTDTAFAVSFSSDNTYMSVAHDSSPYITIYKRSADTFTKLSNPSTLPTDTGRDVAWSSDGTYMSVVHNTSPFVTIYKRSADTFTKLSNPPVLPVGTGQGVTFSSDDLYMSVAHDSSPYITIYKRAGDNFVKLSDPVNLPTDSANEVNFIGNNEYMAVAHNSSSYLTVYEVFNDSFTKVPDPAILPTGNAFGVNFSFNGRFLAVAHDITPFITIYKLKLEDESIGTTTVSTNKWYRLTGVFNSPTDRRLYVDGVLDAAGTESLLFNSSSTNKILLGISDVNNPDFYLNGSLSDARVWSTAQNQIDIEYLSNKRLAGDELGLVGYWKLDAFTTNSVVISGTLPSINLFPSNDLFPSEPGFVVYDFFDDLTVNNNDGTSSNATLTLDTPYAESIVEIIPDFTGSFLCGKDDIQINFIHNGQINGLTQVKKDAVIETIGSKYPFIVRNSSIGYKQFQFNALITHVSDPTRSLKGLTYTELITGLTKDSNNNFIFPAAAKDTEANLKYEDFLLEGPQVKINNPSKYAELSNNGKNFINQPHYLNKSDNFVIEKQFRKKIIEWLNDGNPKIFKSDTEGLFLVKLTNVGFEPVQELGRTLYTFSCTMTEIDEINYDNLVKHGLRKAKYSASDLYVVSNVDNFAEQWSTNSFLPQTQYFYVQDSYREFRYYEVLTSGTTGVTIPSVLQVDTSATYTSSSGTYTYKFVGYSIPGKF